MKTFLSFLLISIPLFLYPQSDTLDLDKFLEEVVRSVIEKMNRAKDLKYGTEVQIISDQKELKKLRSNIQKQRKEAEEARQKELDKNPGAKYKAGDKSVVPELIEILKGTDKAKRRLAYIHLEKRYDDPESYRISEPELLSAIYENLNRREDFDQIISLAAFSNLPGYIEVFETVLLTGKAFQVDRLVYWLGRDGRSIEALDYIIDQLLLGKFSLDGWDRNNISSGLEGYLKNGNEEVKLKVLKLLWNFYDANKHGLKDFADRPEKEATAFQNSVFHLLLCSEDERLIPLARKFIEVKSLQRIARMYLLKVSPDQDLEILLEGLSIERFTIDYINVYLKKFDVSGEKKILEKLFQAFDDYEDYDGFYTKYLVESLISRGQDQFLKELDSNLIRSELIKKVQESYFLLSLTFEDWAKEFLEMGVINTPFSPEVIAKAWERDKKTPHARLYNLMEAAQLVIGFDAEAGVVPLDYDTLILDFVDHSNGILQGLEVWLDVQEDEEYYYNYTVTLLFKGKAYIAKAPGSGDWYDLSMVIGVLNAVLENNQRPERFNDIFTGDQTAQYIFGPPKAVEEFAKKYKLHASWD